MLRHSNPEGSNIHLSFARTLPVSRSRSHQLIPPTILSPRTTLFQTFSASAAPLFLLKLHILPALVLWAIACYVTRWAQRSSKQSLRINIGVLRCMSPSHLDPLRLHSPEMSLSIITHLFSSREGEDLWVMLIYDYKNPEVEESHHRRPQ